MYRTRNIPPAPRPVPKPLAELTRVQLAARLAVLREAVNALFEQSGLDRLTFAQEMPLVPVLVRELLDFRVTLSEQGHDSYGNREGSHDDLVLAVACAAWYGERWRPTTLSMPSTSYSTL